MAPVIAAQTVFQMVADFSFTAGEIIIVFGGFGFLAVAAAIVLVSLLRKVREPAS